MQINIKRFILLTILSLSMLLFNKTTKAISTNNMNNSFAMQKDNILYGSSNITKLYKYDDNSILALNKGDIFKIVEYRQKGNSKILCNEKSYEIPTKNIEIKLIQNLPKNYLEKVKNFESINTIITYIFNALGRPYKLGEIGPDSFDCSGLLQTAFKEAGIDINRNTYTQITEGKKVDLKNAFIGDLTFFNMKKDSGHVGIYIGNNEIIHASPNGGVKISKLKHMDNFNEIRRLIYWKTKNH